MFSWCINNVSHSLHINISTCPDWILFVFYDSTRQQGGWWEGGDQELWKLILSHLSFCQLFVATCVCFHLENKNRFKTFKQNSINIFTKVFRDKEIMGKFKFKTPLIIFYFTQILARLLFAPLLLLLQYIMKFLPILAKYNSFLS